MWNMSDGIQIVISTSISPQAESYHSHNNGKPYQWWPSAPSISGSILSGFPVGMCRFVPDTHGQKIRFPTGPTIQQSPHFQPTPFRSGQYSYVKKVGAF